MKFGVFDSGVGGLTVVHSLRAEMPEADIVYFADQRHVPYGDRDHAELVRLLGQNLTLLRDAGVDAIVMGCNTSCAAAAISGYPDLAIPVFDLIECTADRIAQTRPASVAVVATAATVRAQAYSAAISRRLPDVRVEERAAPLLVPMVEAGVRGLDAVSAVGDACRDLAPCDILVLGCTHFPHLETSFAAAVPTAQILNPAVVIAQKVRERFASGGESTTAKPGGPGARSESVAVDQGVGSLIAWTSGELLPFARALDAEGLHADSVAVRLSLDDVEDAEEEQHRHERKSDAGDHLREGMRA